MTELKWGWPEIAVTLMWKLAPKGLVLYPHDLTLPRDRVLLENRAEDRIKFAFIALGEAHARSHAVAAQRANVSKLAGRWHQITAVMMWKLAKGGVTLTEWDRHALPINLQLMTSGHPDGVEWRFLPRSTAAHIQAWDLENEGVNIMEIDR